MQKASKTINMNILFILVGILFVLISFFLLVLILDSDDFHSAVNMLDAEEGLDCFGTICSLRGVS